MLEYDRIDVSEGLDTNKTHGLHECTICHYWYNLRINFRFQPKVCDGHHDMTQKPMSFDDTAVVTVKGNDYRINFWFITKNEAMDRMKNDDLIERSGPL